MRTAGVEIDLGIMDEAHKTVGDKKRLFSHLLFDENLPIKRRVFMTATERRFAGDSDAVVSMDDPAIYGDTVELLTFKTALEQDPPIISDYKIISMVISQAEIETLITQNRYLRPETARWDDEVEAQMLASLIALRKAMHKSSARAMPAARARAGLLSSIAMRRLARPSILRTSQPRLRQRCGGRLARLSWRSYDEAVKFVHPLGLKSQKDWNAYCRGHQTGLEARPADIPANPPAVYVDVFRAQGGWGAWLGTANRRSGWRLYDEAVTFVHALGLKSKKDWDAYCGKQSKPVDIPASPARVYSDVFRERGGWGAWLGTANRRGAWRLYDEAMKFVHPLGLKSQKEWHTYCRGDRPDLPTKPMDIPPHPEYLYGDVFRERGGWGAWLGTANRKGGWRLYGEAVNFVHTLGLKSQEDWRAYCRGERSDLPTKPLDVPSGPASVYGKEFRERGGMGAWLGTGAVATFSRQYLPYEKAVTFVHALKLKSKPDWLAYCRGDRPELPAKPAAIPADAQAVYSDVFRERGGWGAWLGTANRRGAWRLYDEAMKFVHPLGLKSQKEWHTYCRGDRPDLPTKPKDIPANPASVYRTVFGKRGGWGAWLGTAYRRSGWRLYDEAMKFVHPLGLKSQKEWQTYCRGDRPDLPTKPMDIPAHPASVYRTVFRKRGGFGAWLGTANRKGGWRPYCEALKFVHPLELKGQNDWQTYCRGNRPDLPAKPVDIPANPVSVYSDEFREGGGWGEWLGTGIVATFNRQYRSYDQAIAFVHQLGLKSQSDWHTYCRGERADLPAKPADVPASPDRVYGDEFRARGGMGGWLRRGPKEARPPAYRTYDDTIAFVHQLGLKSYSDWRAYCRGERPDVPAKPADIPASPTHVFADEFRKRGGWGAFLGTGIVATFNRRYRSYDDAITFVRALGLKSEKDWRGYCRGERPDLPAKPADIPVLLGRCTTGSSVNGVGWVRGWVRGQSGREIESTARTRRP